jgi:hypothetical protein
MSSTCPYAVSRYIQLLAVNKIPPCRISRVRVSAGESYLILTPDNLLTCAAIKRVGLAITRLSNFGVYLYGAGTV